jgi:glutathione peroxidase-family protein
MLDYLDRRFSKKNRGTVAFNFSLPDTKGKIIKLSDLKGQVVLIDLWFTGCPGCLNYSKRLETQVYPLFDNNPDIAFVSISGDRYQGIWLQSVKEGKFTRRENINLYTAGMGFTHPFTKYYNFWGGPFSLLIDRNGKIFNGDPPKDDMSALVTDIKEALIQK